MRCSRPRSKQEEFLIVYANRSRYSPHLVSGRWLVGSFLEDRGGIDGVCPYFPPAVTDHKPSGSTSEIGLPLTYR